jgi:hypothetical protein
MAAPTKARRFAAREDTIYKALQATLRRAGATSLRVEGRDLLDAQDVEARIIFDRGGRRYVVRCARWPHFLDNLRAAERTIYFLHHALAEYGAVTTEQAADAFGTIFGGFEATPADAVLMLGDGTEPWWVVLGVLATATRADIDNAYRALARVHHPDAGGSVAAFQRLRLAYNAAIAARGAA